MQTIAIMNRRGGVGKTATAHALGAGLVKRGKRVLFVDLDGQGNLSFDMGVDDVLLDTFSVLIGEVDIKNAITKTECGDIIPGSPTLSGADFVLTETGKQYRLKEALAKVKKSYDYAIIDTPPALGILAVNALTAADKVVIAAQAEIHSIQGITMLLESITAVRKHTNNKLAIDGILITRYNGRAILSQDMKSNIEQYAEEIHTKVYTQPIRECIAIKEAQACRINIFNYAPASNAAADYNAFIEEFLKGERT